MWLLFNGIWKDLFHPRGALSAADSSLKCVEEHHIAEELHLALQLLWRETNCQSVSKLLRLIPAQNSLLKSLIKTGEFTLMEINSLEGHKHPFIV